MYPSWEVVTKYEAKCFLRPWQSVLTISEFWTAIAHSALHVCCVDNYSTQCFQAALIHFLVPADWAQADWTQTVQMSHPKSFAETLQACLMCSSILNEVFLKKQPGDCHTVCSQRRGNGSSFFFDNFFFKWQDPRDPTEPPGATPVQTSVACSTLCFSHARKP